MSATKHVITSEVRVQSANERVASADKKAFLLRLDPRLWSELERLAAAELRSVNGQIEYLLREALAARGVTPGDARKASKPKGR